MVPIYLLVFISALVFSFALTWYLRDLALARGWVAQATSGRHIHEVPLPRIGGVAIYISFVTIISALVIGASLVNFDIGLSPRTVFYLLFSGTLIFAVGLYDDLRSVSPFIKLAVQTVAGVLLFVEGFRVFQVPLIFGWQEVGLIALPLTVFWVLWITNAFNLIDGLDGLAAGSALFSTITVFIVSLVSNDSLVSLLTIGLAGAILGFLRFNFNPATIFLGDSGSLFIGFMLSALALAGRQKSPTIVAVAIPVVSFGLPILETVLSVLRRWLNGQPLFTADREHIHHKLLDRGLSQRQVVIILYGVSALCGLLSLFLLYPGGGLLGIVLFVLGAGIWIGVQHLDYHELFELRRVAQRTVEQKRIIINNLAIRRAGHAFSKVQDFTELRQVLEGAFKGNDFDGYQLCSLLSEQAGQPTDSCLSQGHRQGSCLAWRKVESSNDFDAKPAAMLTLTLDLMTSANQKRGHFSLYRVYNGRPLLVDINLLTSGFNTALADAVERVVEQQESLLKELPEHARHSFNAV